MERAADHRYRATPQLLRAALELLRPEPATIWVATLAAHDDAAFELTATPAPSACCCS